MNEADKTQIPQIGSKLRQHILKMPEAVFQASGIVINGRRIKSFVFTTDLAIIRNCDADAVFAVYPFTPQQAISDALIKASYIPVFCGVGGGTTKGLRTVTLAKDVESQGAMGVVLNSPISDLNLMAVARSVDIPAGGGEKYSGELSGYPLDRFRRQDKRDRACDDRRRSQCHHLYAALYTGTVQGRHGNISGVNTRSNHDSTVEENALAGLADCRAVCCAGAGADLFRPAAAGLHERPDRFDQNVRQRHVRCMEYWS